MLIAVACNDVKLLSVNLFSFVKLDFDRYSEIRSEMSFVGVSVLADCRNDERYLPCREKVFSGQIRYQCVQKFVGHVLRPTRAIIKVQVNHCHKLLC